MSKNCFGVVIDKNDPTDTGRLVNIKADAGKTYFGDSLEVINALAELAGWYPNSVYFIVVPISGTDCLFRIKGDASAHPVECDSEREVWVWREEET